MGVRRTALWDDSRGVFQAVHARTSFLFTFDPEHDKTVPIGSMAAEPDRGDPRSTFASLAFAQSPDGRIFTIAARGVFDFFNSRPLRGAAHLVSYEPEAGRIVDHGPILVEDGRRLWEARTRLYRATGRPFISSPPSKRPTRTRRPRRRGLRSKQRPRMELASLISSGSLGST